MSKIRLFLCVLCVFCVLIAAAPFEADAAPAGRLKIVTTIFPAYDFARAVTGGKADLSMLVRPGSEIHSFDPSPQDIISIRNADVFIYIGGENDAWVTTLLKSSDLEGKTVLRLIDHVDAVEEELVEGMQPEEGHSHGHEEPEHEGEEQGHGHDDEHHDEEHDEAHDEDHENEEQGHDDEHHDEEHGEAHDEDHANEEHEHGHEGVLDEHIWTSPKNAAILVGVVADALSAADPSSAAEYKARAAAYSAEILALGEKFKALVASAARKKIVVGDRFPFRYFVDEFGLDYSAAFPGCHTESDVSVATMAYLVKTVESEKIPVVYTLELGNGYIARAIAEQTGAEVLVFHSCHNLTGSDFAAGKTYVSLMEQNLENLRKGLY